MKPGYIVRSIAAATRGRYLVEVPQNDGPHPLLVGFHGYGENAEIHLDQLRRIPGISAWLITAVQALHPFYNRSTGEVVASWMTKLDREQAIQDNVDYVGNVIAEIKREYAVSDCTVYAGFSQGVAMACRAAAYAGHACHALLLLGSGIPPDIKQDPPVRFPPVLLGRGRHDTWYTQETMERDLEFLTSKGSAARTLVFEGAHEWGEDFFNEAALFLHRLAASKPAPDTR